MCYACRGDKPWTAFDVAAFRLHGRADGLSKREAAQVFESMERNGIATPRGPEVAPARPAAPPVYPLDDDSARALTAASMASSNPALPDADREGLERLGVAGHPLLRVWPRGRRAPSADLDGWLGSWLGRGYRLIIPMASVEGRARSVKLRPLEALEDGAPKDAHLTGSVAGLLFACPLVLRALRGEIPMPPVVVWTEGEKDFAAALSRWHGAHPTWGFLGVISGGVTDDWIKALGEVRGHVMLTDPDGAGDGYRHDIRLRWRRIHGVEMVERRINVPAAWCAGVPYDVRKAPDVADAVRMGRAPSVLPDPLVVDTDAGAVARDPSVDADVDDVVRAALAGMEAGFMVDPSSGALLCQRGEKADPAWVASAPPVVVATIDLDRATGVPERRWRIAARDALGGTAVVEVPAAADGRALAAALSGVGVSVDRGAMAGALGTWIPLALSLTRDMVPHRHAVTACGWVERPGGVRGFLAGDTWVGTPGSHVAAIPHDPSVEGWLAAVHTRGTLEGQLEALRALRGYPIPSVLLLSAVAAPIAPIVDLTEGAILFAVARSGTAKTLALQAAASAHGNPSRRGGVLTQWRGSGAGVERTAQAARHIGLDLDDTATMSQHDGGWSAAQRKAATVAEVAYQLAGGIPRALATARTRATWLALHRATAEADPLPSGDFAGLTEGAAKRLLCLRAKPWTGYDAIRESGEITPQLQGRLTHLSDGIHEHYGHLVPAIAARLLDLDHDAVRADWRKARDRWAKVLTDNTVRYAAHYAQILAVLDCAQFLLSQVCQAVKVAPIVDRRALDWLAAHLSAQATEAPQDLAVAAFLRFREWAATQRGPHGPIACQLQDGRSWQARSTNARAVSGVWLDGSGGVHASPVDYSDPDPMTGLGRPGDLKVTRSALDEWARQAGGCSIPIPDLVYTWHKHGWVAGKGENATKLRTTFRLPSQSVVSGWVIPAAVWAEDWTP